MMTIREAALSYVQRGWSIFMLKPRSKFPLQSKNMGGKGVKDATRDAVRAAKWCETFPNANIGIATGVASGFFVVDVDPRHGGDETLAALERAHGSLPQSPIAHTGGGGQHRLFQHVAGVGNSASRLGAGLDVRGDGGYIVAAPSIHENGRPYAWSVDHDPADMPIAPAPQWLLELIVVAKKNGTAHPPEYWRTLVGDGINDGARNDSITRLVGMLLHKSVDPLATLEIARCVNGWRCRPPLEDDEILKIMNSICERELARRRHG